MILRIFAEAVNAVAEWPSYEALCCDDPHLLRFGLVVGETAWHYTIRDLKQGLPDIQAKVP